MHVRWTACFVMSAHTNARVHNHEFIKLFVLFFTLSLYLLLLFCIFLYLSHQSWTFFRSLLDIGQYDDVMRSPSCQWNKTEYALLWWQSNANNKYHSFYLCTVGFFICFFFLLLWFLIFFYFVSCSIFLVLFVGVYTAVFAFICVIVNWLLAEAITFKYPHLGAYRSIGSLAGYVYFVRI